MKSEDYVCNLLVVNGQPEDGDRVINALTSSGVQCRVTHTRSADHYQQSLTGKTWDLIIAREHPTETSVESETPTFSLTQALEFRRLSSSCAATPFIIIAADGLSPTRCKWMAQGASDVVEENSDQLLALVVKRELNRSVQPTTTIHQSAPKHPSSTQIAPNLERQATESDAHGLVQHALDNQAFRLLFQPIASLRGDDEAHYDVLLRIVDPKGEEISAGQFMGAIETTALAEKIDKWVILQSVKRLLQQKSQRQQSQQKSHLFLHISAASIQDKKFLPWLFLLIKKSGIPPQSLVFQLAEESVVRFPNAATHTLNSIAKIGCRTSICHFGSSADPMAIAKDFTTHYVKLTGTITAELATNADQEQPIREMIEGVQALGCKTIVPHIENPNVMTRVWRTGSDYVQGYFLQPPKPDMDYDFSSD